MKKIRSWKGLLGAALALCLLGALPALAAAPGETVVTTPPAISADISPALSVPAGGSFTLALAADGEELSFQWYFNSVPIEGAVESVYTVTGVTSAHAGSYFCYVTNALGSAQSGVCTVTVLEPPVLTADINITALTLSEGDIINLTAAASGSGVSAQWYYVLNTTDIRPIDGAVGSTLSIPASTAFNGADIYCQFLNEAGAVATSFCRVTVNAVATPTPSPTPKPDPPKETKPPYGETVEEGGAAIFIARAEGATGYVWRFVNSSGTSYDYTSINGLFPGLRVSGGDTDTLSLSAIPRELNNWSVCCLFKGDGGETLSASAEITVLSTASSITITKQPTGGTMALDENMDFTLAIQAASESGGALSYQWYSSPTNSSASMTPISGATNSSYRPERREGTTYYRVGVSVNTNGTVSQPFFSYTVGVTFTAGSAHQHVYSDAWDHDDISHWHQCTCGDHAEEARHSYVWTVVVSPTADRDGQQKGVCSVCGYETVQPIPAGSMPQEGTEAASPAKSSSSARSFGWLYALLGAAAVVVIGGAAFLIQRILRQDEEWDEEEDDAEEETDPDDTQQE